MANKGEKEIREINVSFCSWLLCLAALVAAIIVGW